MQKVISVNLNGHVYQLDESGYERLRAYLGHAEQQLAANPDRAEILADLEQAIADKCQRYLGPHKSVVAADEMRSRVFSDRSAISGGRNDAPPRRAAEP